MEKILVQGRKSAASVDRDEDVMVDDDTKASQDRAMDLYINPLELFLLRFKDDNVNEALFRGAEQDAVLFAESPSIFTFLTLSALPTHYVLIL